ncbi:MAG: NADP-dependent oxidoreductase [Pseudomonadota bacterium]
MSTGNQQWRLADRDRAGYPVAADFVWGETPAPQPVDGQMLTRTIYLSLDPYQWVRRRSGVEQPGEVCHGRTVAQVLESRIEGYAPGDYIFNTNGWQSHGLTGKDISVFNYMFPRKLDPELAPLSTALGIHGMLGLTAYAGLIVQCDPRPGETVVVSAASGGVGQVVGQLARIVGARVIGIAGAQEKCRYVVDELGFDACVSHLSDNLAEDIAKACPDGCDVYFENVGGKTFAALLPSLNKRARISLCGVISQYGNEDGRDARTVWQETGAKIFERQEVTVHDLFVGNYVADYQDIFLQEMAAHIQDGAVRYKEHFWAGLEQAPEAFAAMLTGDNFGKSIVTVSDP